MKLQFTRVGWARSYRSHRTAVRASLVWLALIVSGSLAAELPEPVVRALDRYELNADDLSVWIQPLDGGEPIVVHNADDLRNPASTMKLVTTYAGLERLLPNYQWETEVFLLGELDSQGVLQGDLAIRGGGDPYLVEDSLRNMLSELRRRGLSRITGNIILDDSAFAIADTDPGAFDGEPLRAYNVAPDALLVNFKVFRFVFEPDPGRNRVRITSVPAVPELTIINELKLVKGRCRGYQKGIAIHGDANANSVRFSGTFPDGCERYSMSRSLMTHDGYAAALLHKLWLESGGALDGLILSGTVDDEQEPWLSWSSRPLSEQVRLINKFSNNVMTRHLFLTLGAETFGEPASLAKSREAMSLWLTQQGFDPERVVVDNGAGLSRDTRISASTLAQLLRQAWRSRFMPEFVSSLSLVGLDGTFRRRFRNGPVTGRAHLKTGRLDGVTAMAGYAIGIEGRRYVVVALHNAPEVHRGTGEVVQNAILEWVYRYRSPDEAIDNGAPTPEQVASP